MDEPLNVNPLPPSNEEQVIYEKRREDLPKLNIPKGEMLYITSEELPEIFRKYYDILSDMAQAVGVPADLRSAMEDTVCRSFMDEIAIRRHDNQLDCEVEWARVDGLNATVTPRTWRSWRTLWLRKKRNEAQVLLEELIGRQSFKYLQRKQDELPSVGETSEADYTPHTVLLAELQELLPRKMRKKKREAWEAVIAGLSASYESKSEEQKRCAETLTKQSALLKEANERISELEELTAQLIEESEEVTDEEEEAGKEEKEPKEINQTEETPEPEEETEEENAEADENGVESEESDETDEDDGLSYDGLEEGAE